ncbi:MAG: hypothetical protein GTO24_13200, partial [candidate division Zixibacteria bacterium]|nr:hypothetical protein [candidate division Zixibacteria bacterium]
MIVYLIIGSVFVAVFLFFFAVLYLLSRSKDPVQLRLKDLEGKEEGTGEKKQSLLSLKAASDLLGLGAGDATGT